MSYRSTNERSPLLKSIRTTNTPNDANSSHAYSENSSREEARPFGELTVLDNNESQSKSKVCFKFSLSSLEETKKSSIKYLNLSKNSNMKDKQYLIPVVQ
jgi:hypothetical protein